MTREKSSKWLIKSESTEIRSKEEILDILLHERGISSENRERFIETRLSDIPSFYQLHDSVGAAKKIITAITDKKKIFIHGDFDADGICATSLLWDFLYRYVARRLEIDVDVMPFIPSRKDDGYGLSDNTIEKLKEEGAELVITVDCGVRDTKLIEKYEGIEFIITDHHQPEEGFTVPEGLTLVHPMYPNEEYPQTSISGTFVAFLITQAIKSELKEDTEIKPNTVGLDLVALSTVTDIMPLLDSNRVIVHYGLDQIRHRTRIGLDMLMNSASITPSTLNSYHLGFVIGPRINAAGRIGDPMDGVRLLTTLDKRVASQLSAKISNLNMQRQKITDEIMMEAEKQIVDGDLLITVIGDDWPEGIVGLVAGKLMDKYNRPTLVMSRKEEIRGSARSLGGYNITHALDSVSATLIKYGGHAEAAGFTLESSKYEAFISQLKEVSGKDLKNIELTKEKSIDICIRVEEANIGLVLELQKLEPYGHKNPKPIFCIKDVEIIDKRTMGSDNNHLKLTLKDDDGNRLDSVMFDCKEDIVKLDLGDRIDVIGYLDINEWNGTASIQMHISEWSKD